MSDDSHRITRLEAETAAHEEHDRERFAELRDGLTELRSELRTSLGELRADAKSVLEKVQSLSTAETSHRVMSTIATGVVTAVLTAAAVHLMGSLGGQ